MSEAPAPKLWIERNGRTVGAFGRRLHALLAAWQSGIYHIDKAVLHKRVKWDNEHWIEIVIHGALSTYDFDSLTRLVFLAHDHAIRVQIKGAGNGYMRLGFSPRTHDPVEDHELFYRHPTLAEAVERHRTRHAAPEAEEVS